ncbi:MAG: thioredoxin [Magnetococcales bacterium]|nr:thioredoxin [Magnetococcales bacterium]MBF0155971.1 thioredoxin [Magnetococcales bacterium]
MTVLAMTMGNFESTIDDNAMVIVDFWAPWCGPCRAFGPIFEKVSEQYPDVVFAKVNTDEERELAGTFQIRSIPTLMVFKEKTIVYSQPGMVPEKEFSELVQKVRELDMEKARKEMAAKKAGPDGD